MTKICTAGNEPIGRSATRIEVGDDRRAEAADDDGDDVARRRESPHPPIDAERDEEDVPRREHDRQRRQVDGPLEVRSRAPDREEVRDEERRADEDEVREHLDQSPRLEDQRAPERRLRALDTAPRALLEVAQEAPELHEQDEGHEDADAVRRPLSSTL